MAKYLEQFDGVQDPKDKMKLLIQASKELKDFPESSKVAANRVMGCTSQVWIDALLDSNGILQFSGTSDSELTRGLCAILVDVLSGLKPEEFLEVWPKPFNLVSGFSILNCSFPQVDETMFMSLNLGPALLTPSRANGFANMLETMRRRTRSLICQLPRFPSLVITADSLEPQGTFAEAQAKYLRPESCQVC
jgi:quinolinate synthase